MEELLVWVDENDTEIGYGEKMETHRKGQLHRAFSLFIFDQEERTLLIHQRAPEKYHSGGLWTNSCCSHPRKGEALQEAVVRRAFEELGLHIPDGRGEEPGPVEVGKFQYFQKYEICAEHEIDHVFILEVKGRTDKLCPNQDEIHNLKWITMPQLKAWMKQAPENFTAWFPTALNLVEKSVIGAKYFI